MNKVFFAASVAALAISAPAAAGPFGHGGGGGGGRPDRVQNDRGGQTKFAFNGGFFQVFGKLLFFRLEDLPVHLFDQTFFYNHLISLECSDRLRWRYVGFRCILSCGGQLRI